MRALVVAWAAALFAAGVARSADASSCGVVETDEMRPYGKLRWRDFQGGKPDPRTGAQITMSFKAFYEIAVSAEGGEWVARAADVCVAAVMHKRRSSVQVDDRHNRGLDHEQLHFDITEHFARQLNSELASFRARARSKAEALKRLESAVSGHYKRTVAAWQKLEERYDRETNHGGRPIPQEQWRRYVRETLGVDPTLPAATSG